MWPFPGRRPPTDREILRLIYDRYYDEFVNFVPGQTARPSKVYIPIDVQAIASQLNVDVDIVFGRFYYHLEHKHGYEQKDGSWVHLFTREAGGLPNCIHFVVLDSVLAELESEHGKHRTATLIAIVATVISVAALFAG